MMVQSYICNLYSQKKTQEETNELILKGKQPITDQLQLDKTKENCGYGGWRCILFVRKQASNISDTKQTLAIVFASG